MGAEDRLANWRAKGGRLPSQIETAFVCLFIIDHHVITPNPVHAPSFVALYNYVVLSLELKIENGIF